MYKSLNSKLVLIFIVFIIAVMATVGIFLMNSIYDYYNDEFVRQIDDGLDGIAFERMEQAMEYSDYAAKLKEVLLAYSSTFGFDNYRNFFILDDSANILSSSDESISKVDLTENILSAMNGKTGKHQTYGAKFLDYAVYLENGANKCIVYIKGTTSRKCSRCRSYFFPL